MLLAQKLLFLLLVSGAAFRESNDRSLGKASIAPRGKDVFSIMNVSSLAILDKLPQQVHSLPFQHGNWNYLGIFLLFFGIFFFVLVAFLCFSAFLGFCASLLFCFSAFLLLCFSAFPLHLLLCFSTSPIVCLAFLLLKFLLAALPCFHMCLPFLFVWLFYFIFIFCFCFLLFWFSARCFLFFAFAWRSAFSRFLCCFSLF